MSDKDRVITAKVPGDLAARLDLVAVRIDRTKSWIVREAVSHWLAEEDRRYKLTLEALEDIDAGRLLEHDEILAFVAKLKKEREEGDIPQVSEI